jgi:hypothetical protein
MIIPNGGKVVIVDDKYQEILPLIKILSKKSIAVLYFSGRINEIPTKQMEGVRLLFLDMRFSTNADAKTVVSNACGLLDKIIGNNNGPYLLIVWSSTGNEYKDELEQSLADKKYKPEFILYLSKADYFESKASEIYTQIDNIKEIIDAEDLDEGEEIIEKITEKLLSDQDEMQMQFKDEDLDRLETALFEGLKEAGLLSLFILWENTVRNSVPKVVNEIYLQIPDIIPVDKKLPAMVYYLAKNRLEKQFGLVGDNDKFLAALFELNDLFSYFYSEDVVNIPCKSFQPVNIQNNTELVPSDSKFNTWKMIIPSHNYEAPGNIYKDSKKRFEFFHLVNGFEDKAVYDQINNDLKSDNSLTYVFININGECETAQDRYPVVRIIPGLIISCDRYNYYKSNGKIKDLKNAKSYLFKQFEVFEHNGNDSYLLFNINQCTFVKKKSIPKKNKLFALNRKYYLSLRQSISNDFSQQGIDLYKA